MSYENWSREELLEEIERLRRVLENDGKLRDRPAEEIRIDANLNEAWHTDATLVKSIFERIAEFVYYVEMSAEGVRTVRFASPHIEHIYGISRNEYLADVSALVKCIHPEDIDVIRQSSTLLLRDKIPLTFTYRFFHAKKDAYVWLEETIYPQTNAAGTIVANLGVIRDVTARIEAQHNLKESRASLEMVLNAINQVVYHIDFSDAPKHKVIYLSKNIEELLGVTYDEYTNNPSSFGQYCHPEDIQEVVRVLEQQQQDRQPKTFRYRYLHQKRKEYIWLEEYVMKTFSPEGKITTAFGITREVTQQKEAEDRLRTSEERFRMLAQNADDVIFRIALYPQPHYEYMSPAIELLTGYLPEAFYADPTLGYKIMHPSEVEKYKLGKEAIEGKHLLEGSAFIDQDFVVRWVHKNGRILWTETRNKPILDADGKIIAVEGISRDITQSKLAEEELVASREYYRQLIEQAPDGILILDLNGQLLSANPAALKVMGAESIDGFLMKSVLDYMQPIEHTRVTDRMRRVQQGEQVPFELVHAIDVQGNLVELETKPMLYHYQGEPAMIVYVRDISVLRRLENEQLRAELMEESNRKLQSEIQDRIRAERQLGETQKNLRLLIDSSLDTISAADRDGHIIEFNPAAEQTFGYTREEALGEHLAILFGGDTEQQKQVIEHMAAEGFFAGEVLNRRKNGQLFTSFLSASLLRNEDGEVIGSMGVSRDITERKHFERQLIETQKSLRLIIDSSLDMIIAADRQGIITEFNASAERTFGYTREEAIGMLIDVIYVNAAERKRITQDLLESNSYFAGEVTNRRKNGESFYSYLSASILRDDKGAVIGSMGISRDISDRIRAERELALREEKYRAVFNQAYTGIALVSVDRGYYMEVNERLCNMLGYTRDQLLNMSVHELHLPGDLSRLPKGEDFIRRGFRHIVDEHRYRHQQGQTVFVSVTITLVHGDDNQPLYFVYVYEDLTPKRKAEEQLRLQAAKLNAIIESSSHIIWTIDVNNKLTSFNRNLSEWLRRAYNKAPHLGLDMLSQTKQVSGEYGTFWRDKTKKTFAGHPQHFEVPFTLLDGTVMWREIYLNPITDDHDKVIEVSCIAHDITEMKNAEEQIRHQAAQLNAIIESSSHMIWTANRQGEMTSFNENQAVWLERAYGHRPFVGMSVFELKTQKGETYTKLWQDRFRLTFEGQPQNFESSFVHEKGRTTWREVYLNPIKNEKGEVVELSCIAHDITDRKAANETLRQSLKEKEVLLKEVHHRVKNNLQVISSILNLQSAYVRDQKTLELLNESQNRIKSMAFVHESLYQTKDFSNINFSDYIGNISRNLLHSYASSEAPPELELKLAELQLNLDTAIPCGLIINELLSNALKYAFHDKTDGRLLVALSEMGGTIKIVISDNGPGLPDTVDYRNTESLGLQLVVTLVEQINGKIKLENKKGAKFTIEFTSTPANQ